MSASAITMDNVIRIVSKHKKAPQEEELKMIEDTVLGLAKKLSEEQNITDLQKLMVEVRPLYDVVGKAKAGKLVRALVDLALNIEQGCDQKVSLVQESVQWATDNKRIYLRRSLQARLARLHYDNGRPTESQKITVLLLSELKKLEDRELLIEVALEDSKAAFALKNLAKARGSMVLARTNCNGVYVSVPMQAGIDMQSGILYSAEDKDFRTAFSYFYEALEGYQLAQDKKNSLRALKYMCVCKVMNNEAEAVPSLLATKQLLPLKGPEVEAAKAMAAAFAKRSLVAFTKALETHKKELVLDVVIATHSVDLHKSMLEKEIMRVVEPYSEIDIAYIVQMIGQPQERIEKTISTMVLDKKIFGCIDQHRGVVRVHPKPQMDKTYTKAVQLIHDLSMAVDAIYTRASLQIH